MPFETAPLLHVEGGRFPEYPGEDPERVLSLLARRYGRVVLVDADGIRRNEADLEFLQRAARKRSVWVDAGSRFATDAMDLFVAGADAVTMRWNTLASVDELEEAASLAQPGALFVGLEFPRGEFLEHPKDRRSAPDVVKLVESLGLGLVYVLGRGESQLARALPASAAVRFVQSDAAPGELEAWGYQGAIIGPVTLEAAPE